MTLSDPETMTFDADSCRKVSGQPEPPRLKLMGVAGLALAMFLPLSLYLLEDGTVELLDDDAAAPLSTKGEIADAARQAPESVSRIADRRSDPRIAAGSVRPSGVAAIAIKKLRAEGVWIPDDFVLGSAGEIAAFVADVRALQEDVRKNYDERMQVGRALAERLYAEGKYLADLTRNYPEQSLGRIRQGLPELRPWVAMSLDDFVYAKFFQDAVGEQAVHYLRIQPGQSAEFDVANNRWNTYRNARDALVSSSLKRSAALNEAAKKPK